MNIFVSDLPFSLLSELVNGPDASFTFSQEGEYRTRSEQELPCGLSFSILA